MIVRHKAPNNGWTKLDTRVMGIQGLSDGAKVLYAALCGLRSGAAYTEEYMQKALGIKRATMTSRRTELRKAELVLVEQLMPRVYVIYIGHSKMTAKQVKAEWKDADCIVVPKHAHKNKERSYNVEI